MFDYILSCLTLTKPKMRGKGISNGPTQTDRGCPFRSVLDRGREKPSPAARRIFASLSAATQTRPKFGRGLHRRRLTDASVRILALLPRARVSSTVACSSPALHRFSGLHRERLLDCFQFCATINGAASLATVASNSAPPSMALGSCLFPLSLLAPPPFPARLRL
jgi:hypothetical protein